MLERSRLEINFLQEVNIKNTNLLIDLINFIFNSFDIKINKTFFQYLNDFSNSLKQIQKTSHLSSKDLKKTSHMMHHIYTSHTKLIDFISNSSKSFTKPKTKLTKTDKDLSGVKNNDSLNSNKINSALIFNENNSIKIYQEISSLKRSAYDFEHMRETVNFFKNEIKRFGQCVKEKNKEIKKLKLQNSIELNQFKNQIVHQNQEIENTTQMIFKLEDKVNNIEISKCNDIKMEESFSSTKIIDKEYTHLKSELSDLKFINSELIAKNLSLNQELHNKNHLIDIYKFRASLAPKLSFNNEYFQTILESINFRLTKLNDEFKGFNINFLYDKISNIHQLCGNIYSKNNTNLILKEKLTHASNTAFQIIKEIEKYLIMTKQPYLLYLQLILFINSYLSVSDRDKAIEQLNVLNFNKNNRNSDNKIFYALESFFRSKAQQKSQAIQTYDSLISTDEHNLQIDLAVKLAKNDLTLKYEKEIEESINKPKMALSNMEFKNYSFESQDDKLENCSTESNLNTVDFMNNASISSMSLLEKSKYNFHNI